ncbi:MAG: hypothetical protein Q8885_02805, partial [Candidatus Phytoplasma stylosanthis]|nr:hypothetical protein [Candidatus Phytoplasma stylosanthis]
MSTNYYVPQDYHQGFCIKIKKSNYTYKTIIGFRSTESTSSDSGPTSNHQITLFEQQKLALEKQRDEKEEILKKIKYQCGEISPSYAKTL